jgi:ABC-2 type transport system ATP-binding protein
VSVSHGAIHGLLGPNGAGKTTTLKMLLGLVRPTSGTFEILGRPAHERGARSALGFLPEQPYFPSQLTAQEALMLYGRLGGMERAAVRSQSGELLARVGLEGRERTLLSRFSRGMLQRLGLAQALLGDPAVLVLDEPASGLDPVGQRDVRLLMQELRDGGTSILLSSHQLSEVEAVCDEVSVLNSGRVAARGRIDDLLRVAGYVSLEIVGAGEVPESVATVAVAQETLGPVRKLAVPDDSVRSVIDALDDAGWRVLKLQPQSDSLEDYFARLLATEGEAACA